MLQSFRRTALPRFSLGQGSFRPRHGGTALRHSAEHHAAPDGCHNALPDAADATADRGQRPDEDDEVHADHFLSSSVMATRAPFLSNMTINGLFTIGQQLVINRMKDNEPVPVAGTAGMKNVTPSKKEA